jgi:competence protein ComEC
MFSFIIAGSFHGSRISVYNNLAASAFFLLLLEPKMIFHAGFQFSYLAVLSIVSLHPHIYHLVTLRNKVADQIWALLSVSVAAQAGTAPLSIWYFHIFPNYFIAGNLLAVPLSTLILYGSVGYLALSPVAAAGGLMMKALHLLVQGMNASVAYIEQLPHSVSRGIWIPGEAVILIYILLMMAGFALEARLYRPSMAAVLLFLLLAADYSMHNAASYLREEFVVFNAGRTALAAFYDARTEHLYNVGDARDKYRMDYLENRRMHHRVRRFCSYGSLSDDNSAILNDRVFAGRGFIIFHAEERRYMIAVGETYDWPNDRIRVDVLVLGRRSGSFEKILALADPAIVVLDATIGRRKASSIAEYCIKAGIPCHDVGIQGAFVATVYRFDSVFRFLGRKCFRSA